MSPVLEGGRGWGVGRGGSGTAVKESLVPVSICYQLHPHVATHAAKWGDIWTSAGKGGVRSGREVLVGGLPEEAGALPSGADSTRPGAPEEGQESYSGVRWASSGGDTRQMAPSCPLGLCFLVPLVNRIEKFTH